MQLRRPSRPKLPALAILAFVVVLASGCAAPIATAVPSLPTQQPLAAEATAPPSVATVAPPSPWTGAASFGVAVPDAASKPGLLTALHGAGVRYIQPEPISLAKDPQCQDCPVLRSAAFDLVLEVQAAAEAGGPSGPPIDPATFETRVAATVDRWHPALISIERDVDDPTAYEGSAALYLAEVRAACYQAHRGGSRCAAAAISPHRLAELTVANLAGKGDASALAVARRSLRSPAAGSIDSVAALTSALSADRTALDRSRQILAGLGAAGTDFVELQWALDQDPDDLAEAASFLRSTTGLRGVVAEVGVRAADAPTALRLAKQLEALSSLAIWISEQDAQRGSEALFGEDGSTTPSGRVLEDQSKARS